MGGNAAHRGQRPPKSRDRSIMIVWDPDVSKIPGTRFANVKGARQIT